MDYESLETLEQLLTDSSATEFREVLPDIPVDKFADDFYQWVDKDGPDSWGQDYFSMFTALGRLVRAESSYDIATASIRTLQKSVQPAAPQPESEPEAPPPPPDEAAKEAVALIGPAIFEKLLQEHPEFVAEVPPNELSDIGMEAIGIAIHQTNS